jgi:hypothetical protein
MRPPRPPSNQRAIARLYRRTRDNERRSASPWHNIGAADEAPFLNGANAAPSAERPNPVPMRYRWTLGAGLELQGDVDNVAPGDIVFVLPAPYRLDHDVPVDAHDDEGNYVACRLLATGEFLYGVA